MLAEILLATLVATAPSIVSEDVGSSYPQESQVLLRETEEEALEGGGVDFDEEEKVFFTPEKVSESLGPVVDAQSALVIDRRSNSVLFSKNIDEQRPLASITKVMTTFLALEGGVSLGDTIIVGSEASSASGASMHLESGDEIRAQDLLVGSLIASGNDAATQLAVYTAGSTDAFVDKMNARADTLGMEDTSFKNPTGLDETGHFSSATDIARLFDVALEYEEFYDAIQTSSHEAHTLNREQIQSLQTTNSLLRNTYPRHIGGKTGFTDDAGYCLVTLSSDDDGNEIISVVLGSSSSDERFNDMKALITWTYTSYAWKKPL